MKLFATLAVLIGATIGSASATLITYDTTGSVFTVINGVNQAPGVTSFTITGTASGNTARIAYLNTLPGGTFDDTTPGTNIQLGVFQSTYAGTDVNIAIPAFTFVLHLNETGPGMGTDLITGSYAGGGTISANSSNVSVFWNPVNSTLLTTNYIIQTPTPINAPSTNNGASSVNAFALGRSAVPEPGSMFLLGAGLIGVGFAARKKFAGRS